MDENIRRKASSVPGRPTAVPLRTEGQVRWQGEDDLDFTQRGRRQHIHPHRK